MLDSSIPDLQIFIGIAALGLTVTGFSGLISVLGRRTPGYWSETERFQLSELIVVSLAVTFASFVPVLISLMPADMNGLAVSTFWIALLHLLILVRGLMQNFKRETSPSEMPKSVVVFMVGGGLGLIVAGFLASFGVIGGVAFLLVANLLWQLMVAAIHFVLLIMTSGTED